MASAAAPAGGIPGSSPYSASDALLCYSAPDFLAPSQLGSQRAQAYLQFAAQCGAQEPQEPASVDRDASTVTIPEFDFSLPVRTGSIGAATDTKIAAVPSSVKSIGLGPDNVFVPVEQDDLGMAASSADEDLSLIHI